MPYYSNSLSNIVNHKLHHQTEILLQQDNDNCLLRK